MGAKKNFVLDTNVILHDYKCIENFQENDIYLPIVVLEELDKFKKGSDQINYNAREFVRELDTLTSNDLFLKGDFTGTWQRHFACGDRGQVSGENLPVVSGKNRRSSYSVVYAVGC